MFSTQRQEVLEILEILQICQLLIGKIPRKYIESECQNGRRAIRHIRDITGVPASDWQNIQEIRAE